MNIYAALLLVVATVSSVIGGLVMLGGGVPMEASAMNVYFTGWLIYMAVTHE